MNSRRGGILPPAVSGASSNVSAGAGSAGTGVLLLFAVMMIAFLLVCEFFYAFGVKQNLDDELSRAANIAVDLAMSDAHRQDHLSELDAGAAYTQFFDYLYNDMSLSSSLEAKSPDGDKIYSLKINELNINPSPPGIRVTAAVTVQPIFLRRLVPAPIRFTIRVSSVNRRKE